MGEEKWREKKKKEEDKGKEQTLRQFIWGGDYCILKRIDIRIKNT